MSPPKSNRSLKTALTETLQMILETVFAQYSRPKKQIEGRKKTSNPNSGMNPKTPMRGHYTPITSYSAVIIGYT